MRAQTQRNLIATLFLSQGVRMMLAGDEMGRTQNGNNNAYCQDNEISWVDWELSQTNRELLEFTRDVIAIFRDEPGAATPELLHGPAGLRRRRQGHHVAAPRRDGDDGRRTGSTPTRTCSACCCTVARRDDVDERGRRTFGDTLLVADERWARARATSRCPQIEAQGRWEIILNTARPGATGSPTQGLRLGSHSLIALRFAGVAGASSVDEGPDLDVPPPAARRSSGSRRAAEIVPYLAALGVGDVYASPILASATAARTATTASTRRASTSARGGDAGFRALVAAAQAHGMGLLVDIVPNHLATSEQNPLVVGCAAARPRVAACARLRHRLGRAGRSAASCCCRCSAGRSTRCSRRAS